MHEVLHRIRNGASFKEMAKKYSQSSNAEEGGELGSFEADDLNESIRDAIEGLDAGQITEVLDTGQGVSIFQVSEKNVSGGKSLEEATDEIQDLLFRGLLDEKFKSWIGELKKRSHIKVIR